MPYPHTKILCTPKRLSQRLAYFRRKLEQISNSEFWGKHLQSRNFRFEPGKFDWDYWQTLPYFEKSDFLHLGFGPRLKDLKEKPGHKQFYALRSTSGTARDREPVLLLHKVRPLMKRGYKKYGASRALWLESSFATALIGTLTGISGSRRSGYIFSSLVMFPPTAPFAKEALLHFSPISLHASPSVLAYTAPYLQEVPSLKKINLTGDFADENRINIFRSLFPQCKIIVMYGIAELGGRMAKTCQRARKKFGPHAFHTYSSKRWQLAELADINPAGIGEIILTRLEPASVSLIRYRTGDMARVIEEKCECGADFTLLLEGRKDYDFIKLAGALLTRVELERVIGNFTNEIEDWRAEIGEKLTVENTLVNELKIKIKLALQARNPAPDSLDKISSYIEDNLFMTPTKTFSDLVREKRFLPLKLEIVENFPRTAKILRITKSQ